MYDSVIRPLKQAAKAAPVRVDAAGLTFAQHDPALCSMPGLFRYVSPKERDKCVGLRLKYAHRADLTIEVHNSAPLDGIDLAVLQGIVALAAVHGETVDVNDAWLDDVVNDLARALAATSDEPVKAEDGALAETAARYAEFNSSNMVEIIGLSVNGGNRALVDASVLRLSTCVLITYNPATPKDWHHSFLLGSVRTGVSSDKWRCTHVLLNPRLTDVILGTEARHTRVSLEETRKLGVDQVSRILHQRLCSWINDGGFGEVNYGTLLEYVWPTDETTATADAARRGAALPTDTRGTQKLRADRLAKIRKGLITLTKLGWVINAKMDRKFVADKNATVEENQMALNLHKAKCAAYARTAEKNEFSMVWDIRRPKLARIASRKSTAKVAADAAEVV